MNDNFFSHVDNNGKASMVNVSAKKEVYRKAVAKCFIHLSKETIKLIKENNIKKGDVITVARLAGIMSTKQTQNIIPLCHSLNIDNADVKCCIIEENEKTGIEIISSVTCFAKTGVEMEALTSASITALTIWDMCKAVDKNMKITDIELIKKIKSENIEDIL